MDTATSAPTLAFPASISPATLGTLMGRADAPLLLDVRRPQAFAASDRMLAGARHCAPEQVAALAASRPPGPVVTYCVYGHGVGSDAAAVLAAAGWDARWLAGGIEGGEPGVDPAPDVERWRAAAPPRIRKRPGLGVTGVAPSRWITRARPKIDRVACPWLIRRFVDPRAEFYYVPEGQVFEQARQLGATAFDIEGAPLSHQWERCSFDALLDVFSLQAPGLQSLAAIVRGADTDRPSLAPQSAGLLAFSLGLSRLHADDDQAMLAAAMPLYDALYEWCRNGGTESHRWQAHQPTVAT